MVTTTAAHRMTRLTKRLVRDIEDSGFLDGFQMASTDDAGLTAVCLGTRH
jgi:hypothetical protein